jgi:hypothetical protein
MKLILSRKGFDSTYGGMPSPILPDGRLISLPIPSRHDRNTFRDLSCDDIPLGALLRDLSRDVHSLESTIHLDPDLDRPLCSRLPGWRPSLGQTGNAQSHLAAMGIGSGDVFIFFGWFREVEERTGKWRFRREAPNIHAMFGWLEVDLVLPVVSERDACLNASPWIANHPHVATPTHYTDPRNTLYVAKETSEYRTSSIGGGRFTRMNKNLCLTHEGSTRSIWSLPMWFMPTSGKTALSFHSDPRRWRHNGDRAILSSVAKGQEFVLNCDEYPFAENWVREVVSTSQ